MEVKEMYPLTSEMAQIVEKRDTEIKSVISGRSDRLMLVIGPCSADNEDSVMDYISRLRVLQEKVKRQDIYRSEDLHEQAENDRRRLQGNASSARSV